MICWDPAVRWDMSSQSQEIRLWDDIQRKKFPRNYNILWKWVSHFLLIIHSSATVHSWNSVILLILLILASTNVHLYEAKQVFKILGSFGNILPVGKRELIREQDIFQHWSQEQSVKVTLSLYLPPVTGNVLQGNQRCRRTSIVFASWGLSAQAEESVMDVKDGLYTQLGPTPPCSLRLILHSYSTRRNASWTFSLDVELYIWPEFPKSPGAVHWLS